MSFIGTLLHDFYKIFIIKENKYIGYTIGNFLCERLLHEFILKYPQKHLLEKTIQQVENNETIEDFNDNHFVKYLSLNIIDHGAYLFVLEDIYEKVHKAFGYECSYFTLYTKSKRYIKWALQKKSNKKYWMSKYVDTLSPMGTLDTYSYNIPKELRGCFINRWNLLNYLYNGTNVTFDEFIKTLIIIKGMLVKPKKYNNTPTPLENIDVNKLYNKLR